jgi:N-carbamoyl-L-amino-acid hydrolase
VVAGMELLDLLDEANVQTACPVDLVVWCNEEGCRFSPGCQRC